MTSAVLCPVTTENGRKNNTQHNRYMYIHYMYMYVYVRACMYIVCVYVCVLTDNLRYM